MSYAKRWCFTINNYDESFGPLFQSLIDDGTISYLCVGQEVGQNGTPHYQGCVRFAKKLRFHQVREKLGGNRVHLEQMRGTLQQASDYCKKDGDFFEYGAITEAGQRTDLSNLQAAIQSGASLKEIRDEHFREFIHYSRAINLALSLNALPRDGTWCTQVVYIWGRTRSGKSRFAHQDSQALCNGQVSWLSDPTLQWFNGWNPGSKGAVIDDFDGSPRITLLLRLFDRYPLEVPIKGGYVTWNPRIVWITSNYSLEHWYGTQGEHYDALMARVTECIEMN